MLNRISRHAPGWLRDLEEYIEIWKFYELVDEAEGQIEHNLDQFWVELADEEGLTRWEDAFDLPHTGTIEHRRQEILLLLQAKIPYTFRWLKNYLKIVWDDPKPHVVVHFNGDYIITFQPKQEIDYEQFLKVMRKKIPANLAIEILPAPFIIDDTWLGQGVLDSAGIRLLSSGIYIGEMANQAYIGQGVYESEGDKYIAPMNEEPEPVLMEFPDGSYYRIVDVSGASNINFPDAHSYHNVTIYHVDSSGKVIETISKEGTIYNLKWYKVYPQDCKLYPTCKHSKMILHTWNHIKWEGDKIIYCNKCKTIFKMKEEDEDV